MRQIRSALPRLSDRLGLRHAGHPVIAASCAVLYVAVLAEYVFSMAARVPGTATVRDIMLALAVLAGLVGGMFRPDRFLWPALVTGVICFASMFVRQVRQCFSAVWADGFPRCRHRFPVM